MQNILRIIESNFLKSLMFLTKKNLWSIYIYKYKIMKIIYHTIAFKFFNSYKHTILDIDRTFIIGKNSLNY